LILPGSHGLGVTEVSPAPYASLQKPYFKPILDKRTSVEVTQEDDIHQEWASQLHPGPATG
jgi:hypothetical protein